MNFVSSFVFVVIGVLVLALVVWISVRYFSTDSRMERRRRKSNYRVVTKAKAPSVTLSVRTKKE